MHSRPAWVKSEYQASLGCGERDPVSKHKVYNVHIEKSL